jgi:hypothetical protein
MIKNNDLIAKAWLQLSSNNTLYHDQWVSDETYFRAIDKQYPSLTGAVPFSRTALNRALGPLARELSPSNTSGIYQKSFTTTCPYDVDKRRRVRYYYRQVHGKRPSQPLAATDVTDAHAKLFRALNNRMRLSRSEKEKHANDVVSEAIKRSIEVRRLESAKKQQHREGDGTQGTLAAHVPHGEGGEGEDSTDNDDAHIKYLYWTSDQAKKLFCGNSDDVSDVRDVLNERITLLKMVTRARMDVSS